MAALAILEKRVIDLTGRELLQLIDERLSQILDQRDKKSSLAKVYTINQLVKMDIIGGQMKIRSLIKNGLLQTTSDGKISEAELNNYLNSHIKK